MEISVIQSDVPPPPLPGDEDDDAVAFNERKRAQRGRRHIYKENYVSDDQNNGKWFEIRYVFPCGG